jgi:hypothetical protein
MKVLKRILAIHARLELFNGSVSSIHPYKSGLGLRL